MDLESIRLLMEQGSDYKNAEFFKKTSPYAANVTGMRVPDIRKTAKIILKQDPVYFLSNYTIKTHEDILLYGIIVSLLKLPLEEKITYIKKYVPKIYDWSTCDIFVLSLKFKDKDLDIIYDFVMEYKNSSKEFEVRFMIVMLLKFFLKEQYLDRVKDILNNTQLNDYYTQMAAAWLISIMYIKQKDYTSKYLQSNNLDNFTHNKACQKIIESKRVSKENKEYIKTLKRY